MRFILLAGFILSSCIHSSKQGKEGAGPKFYFDQAVRYKEQAHYSRALEKLKELRQRFFYSRWNQKALLLSGDIYFAQGKYPQAVQSYEKHLSLYPKKQPDYVLYQIGLSYKSQLPYRSEHDLSLAEPALKAFNKLLGLKPPSPYKPKAQKERQSVLDKKADKELKTALFFKSQGWSAAAFKRVQYFIKNYPKSPLLPKALLAGFQLAGQLNKNPKEFKKTLLSNYPNSPEAQSISVKKQSSGFFKWTQKLL